MNQSITCQQFVEFMEKTLKTNILFIEHQAKLYVLVTKHEYVADYYLRMADNVKVLDFKQIIQIGLEKIEDVNEYSNDIRYKLTSLRRYSTVHTTNDMKRDEAHMIKRRIITQSLLSQLFIEFIRKAISTNNALLKQKSKLYQLATDNSKRADYFLSKAAEIVVLDAEKLLNLGYQTIKELDERNQQELEYLTFRLEVLAITIDD